MLEPVLNSGVRLLIVEHLRELRSAGRFQEIHDLYLQLVAARETTAEICMLGGLAAMKLGRNVEANDALESCLERGPEGTVLGTARFVLGQVALRRGDSHSAIGWFTAFLEGMDQYPDLRAITLGSAYYNRGLAHRQSFRLEESLHDYTLACEELTKENMMDLLCKALHNLAWVTTFFGDAIQTRQALQRARPLCSTTELEWHQRVGEAFLATIDYDPLDAQARTAAQHKAIALCESIVQYTGSDIPPEVRTQAYWVAGTTCVALGRTEDAYTYARKAIESAFDRATGDHRSLHGAAELLREVGMFLKYLK